MADGKISEFLEMQRILAETKGWIKDRHPDHAPLSLLWSIEELGEAIAIIKKKGGDAIMDNPSVRSHFTEECADAFMYLFDMLLSYGITAEEFTDAYVAKFRRNMGRDWHENDAMYERCRWKRVIFEKGTVLTDELAEFLTKIGVKAVFADAPAQVQADGETVVCTVSEEKSKAAEALGMTCIAVPHTPVDVPDLQDFLFS